MGVNRRGRLIKITNRIQQGFLLKFVVRSLAPSLEFNVVLFWGGGGLLWEGGRGLIKYFTVKSVAVTKPVAVNSNYGNYGKYLRKTKNFLFNNLINVDISAGVY